MRTLRLFGHPLHPITVHVPIGALLVATVVDVVGWALGSSENQIVSRWCLGLGLTFGALSGSVGVWDYASLPERRPLLTHAHRHVFWMCCAGGMFAASLVLQLSPAANSGVIVLLDLAGCTCLSVGGWHGAELVYGHGVGTRERLEEEPSSGT